MELWDTVIGVMLWFLPLCLLLLKKTEYVQEKTMLDSKICVKEEIQILLWKFREGPEIVKETVRQQELKFEIFRQVVGLEWSGEEKMF